MTTYLFALIGFIIFVLLMSIGLIISKKPRLRGGCHNAPQLKSGGDCMCGFEGRHGSALAVFNQNPDHDCCIDNRRWWARLEEAEKAAEEEEP